MTPEHETRGKHEAQQPAPQPAPRPAPQRTRRIDSIDPPFADGAPESYASFVPASRGGRPGPVHGGRPESPGGGRQGSSNRKPPFAKKAGLIAGGALVAVIAIVYLAGALVFMDRFMPNTTIMGKDVSLKTTAEVQDLLTDVAKSYQLSVSGERFSLTLTSSDMGTAVNSSSVTDAMHADASPWAWPVEVFVVHDETDKLVTSNGKLDEAVRKAVEAFNEQAEAPRNAGLDYDSGGSRFVVRAETRRHCARCR